MAKTRRSIQEFDRLIENNIKAIAQIEEAAGEARSRADLVADAISAFAGTARFACINAAFFAVWIGWNLLAPRPLRFDPIPFSNLTLLVSLEAILLSIFIMISQNRQRRLADKRNQLDLQINLLAEQENSLMLQMLHELMTHHGIKVRDDRIGALEVATDPEKVADQIEKGMEQKPPPS